MGEDESICGETVDHEERTIYEDEEIWQGVCDHCGAELWVDKKED